LIKRYARRGAVVASKARQIQNHASPPAKKGLTFLYVRWSPTRYRSEQLLGIQKACRELDAQVQIYDARESRETLLDCLTNLPQGVDGLIYEPLLFPEELNAIRALIDKGVAVVFTDVPPEDFEVSSVTFDDYTGGYLAAEHLIRRWHRPVYHVGGLEHPASAQRVFGWRDTMRAHGFDNYNRFFVPDRNDPPCEQVVRGHDYDPCRLGYEAADIIFKHKPIKGGYSICTVNDQVARGIYAKVADYGLKVGVDVHIVGLGDSPFAAKLDPPLSSVAYSDDDGAAVPRLLWQLCQERSPRPRHLIMPVHLVERASSLGLGGVRGRATVGVASA
jgi:LacI family transcriptional regulator